MKTIIQRRQLRSAIDFILERNPHTSWIKIYSFIDHAIKTLETNSELTYVSSMGITVLASEEEGVEGLFIDVLVDPLIGKYKDPNFEDEWLYYSPRELR